jgi:superfamily II DNA/RNA helicase
MVQDEVENAAFLEKKSKRKTLKELRKAAATANKLKSSSEVSKLKETEEASIELDGEAEWGGIKLHILLQKALVSLNFMLPTPIQTAAIPIVATGKFDLVGAAETGSGAYWRTLLKIFRSAVYGYDALYDSVAVSISF